MTEKKLRIIQFTRKNGDCRMLKAAHHAAQLGHQVTIIYHQMNPAAGVGIVPQPQRDGLPVFIMHAPDGVSMAKAMLETFRPDVVHAHEVGDRKSVV